MSVRHNLENLWSAPVPSEVRIVSAARLLSGSDVPARNQQCQSHEHIER